MKPAVARMAICFSPGGMAVTATPAAWAETVLATSGTVAEPKVYVGATSLSRCWGRR